jgi:hypothetical protein
MPQLVSSPQEITPVWLTAALREAGLLGDGRVVEAPWSMIGTGKMANNARFQLRYEGDPGSAPSSLVAKISAADETSRQAGEMGGSYRREVRFYEQIAPHIAMRTPRCFHSAVGESGGDFVLLLEDMSESAVGDQLKGCDLGTARVALAEIVKLHAPFWNDPKLGELEWLTPSTAESAAFAQMILESMWPGFLERFAHGLSADAIALGQRFVDNYMAWFSAYSGPLSLIHADYRLENMLLAPAGAPSSVPPIAVVDWQTAAQGCPLADVAYFLGGSLSVADRRRFERELVSEYATGIRAEGLVLSDEDAWDAYCQFTVHGVLITVLGSMVTGQDPRGDQMFLAMAQAHFAHCQDLWPG